VPLAVADLLGDVRERHLAVLPLLYALGSQPVLQLKAKRKDAGSVLRDCGPDSEEFHVSKASALRCCGTSNARTAATGTYSPLWKRCTS